MRTGIKTAIFAAMTMLATLSASAETISPMVAHDPLMNQIMSKQLTLPGGGVTGAVRIGSGQTITLSMIDPLAPLKPVEGLVEKPVVKAKARRKVRSAAEHLKKLSEDERRADWTGRK
jgi:hypothetical protein